MADTKQSPPRQMVKDFVRKSPSEAPGPAHPCDAPGLSPIEFLQAVYRDPLLPMSIRIDAARGLLPHTEPPPGPRPVYSVPRCTIVIGGPGPYNHGSSPEDPEQTNTNSQSFSVGRSNSHHAQSETPGTPNFEEMNSDHSPIDYSTPPTPTELQEIKAVINRLRPDLAPLPVPEPRFCECGHWVFGPCPLGERCRDTSKLN